MRVNPSERLTIIAIMNMKIIKDVENQTELEEVYEDDFESEASENYEEDFEACDSDNNAESDTDSAPLIDL